MPGGRGTPVHSVRLPEELWRAAQAEAKRRGVSVSELLRDLLERHLKAIERRKR